MAGNGLITLRARDLYRAVMKELPNRNGRSVNELIKDVAAGPAPRFYITLHEFRRKMTQMKRGERIRERKSVCEQEDELFRRYMEWLETTFPRGNYKDAYEAIVLSEAPRFYLEGETACCVFYKYGRLLANGGKTVTRCFTDEATALKIMRIWLRTGKPCKMSMEQDDGPCGKVILSAELPQTDDTVAAEFLRGVQNLFGVRFVKKTW